MQHAAIAQDDEALVETIAVPFWLLDNLLAPRANRLSYFLTECVNGYLIDERCWIRSSKRDSVLAHNPTNEQCVAVIGLHQRQTSMIEIPERLAALMVVAQDCRGKIRSLQVARPFRTEAVNPPVDCLQRRELL